MKKHLSIIVVIVASGLLFSCKNSVELVKRHYGNGYYLSVNKAVKHKTAEQAKNEKVANTELKKVLVNVANEKSITETVKETPVITASSANAPYVVAHKQSNPPSSVDLNTAKKLILWNSKYTDTQKNKITRKSLNGGSSGVNDIVLIILCLLIPPLAVYLKENSIGVHFWIDLILCFLFWIPGVIFAFLVCFDVI
jgi:uncharacterized membrane protein YqaE (UPF0057 family)